MRQMWRARGEDDGSVLKYVTEDEPSGRCRWRILQTLSVTIEFPAEVVGGSFFDDVGNVLATHGHVMFETVLANVTHQGLEVIHLSNSNATIHAIRIVGQFAFAQIRLDATVVVVGRDAEEGEVAFGNHTLHGSECIDRTQLTAQNAQGTELQVVVYEALGIVTTVCTNTFVAFLGKVVVPIEQSGGLA